MNKFDLEHKLLSGGVIFLENIPTYKITLQEMADYGFSSMQSVISFLSMDDEKASKYFYENFENKTTFFLFYLKMIQQKEEIASNLDGDFSFYHTAMHFLSLFFRTKVELSDKYGFIVLDKNDNPIYILHDKNYSNFRDIIKERNCLLDLADIEDENPADEMTRKLLEKRKSLHKKLEKAKRSNGDDEGISMSDLISIFAEAEHMPLQNVYENYDMYQFNNQFNRLKIMDDFHVNIQALLAGAKKESVNLQHWLSKIKQPEK